MTSRHTVHTLSSILPSSEIKKDGREEETGGRRESQSRGVERRKVQKGRSEEEEGSDG